MIKTLRTKLFLGVTPLLAVMVVLGLWAVVMFTRLGGRIDVILRENYRSVLAAQGMKEALERIDSSLLFAIGGEEAQGLDQFAEFRPRFEEHLRAEQNNVTLPGEQAMTDRLAALRAQYFTLIGQFFSLPPEQKGERTRLYFNRLLPTFREIKREADAVLNLNQKNMEDESDRARRAAAVSTRMMAAALVGAVAVATLISVGLSRSILGPIGAVTRGARALARGDLDQVVSAATADELGELAAAFNTMARTIREYREAGTARLLRAQMTAQATIDSFPDPVVVVDPAGVVERANPAAGRLLGVVPDGGGAPWAPPTPVRPALSEVLGGGPDAPAGGLENALCVRDDGQERFYLPRVMAIRDPRGGLIGAAVVLTDVTKFRLVDQLKSDMVATVSHELKTPLTGMQMAVHLMLEEAVGPLNAKQTELMLAARQDSDRLLSMINDLLDLTRIEEGRIALDRRPVAPADLVAGAIGRYESQARDAGVDLKGEVGFALPPVMVDADRVAHVFDNLVGNALTHTPRGGGVRLTAGSGSAAGSVTFGVSDTGDGIPEEHRPHVFEKFYRVPGARPGRGVGLGLAIAREIVVAHGGQIEAAAAAGRGAAFTFTLPTAPEPGGPAPTEARPS